MILLIDNYDSFVHNLARYVRRLGADSRVVRNDAIDVAGIRQLRPCAIILSPGPCGPQQAGCSMDVVRSLHADVPLLGICLGHQAIAEALGGRVIRAAEPVHGRTSRIRHDGTRLFAGLPSPLTVCRYHSLCAEEMALPDSLRVTARTDDGTVMAIEHRTAPTFGVQFHPESILTEGGFQILANFFRAAGLEPSLPPPSLDDELAEAAHLERPLPTQPVTF
jgi:anthranilate synthase/aminodeoxychorismate synthase-like glutamine amidotransferase